MGSDEISVLAPAATYSEFPVAHGDDGERLEAVAEEVAVAFEFNGISHAVMFATPADLEDFALGFSLTEGIIDDARELFEVEVSRNDKGITLSLGISSKRFDALKTRRRSLTGRTGCGICGSESLDGAIRSTVPVKAEPRLDGAALYRGFSALRDAQRLMTLTGAVHAAGWIDVNGSLLLAREDVGRHNALDKLIGAALRSGVDLASGAALITSRASFEMVQKAASMNIGILAAVSAPTALAIRMADALNVSLVGFVRAEHHALYTHPRRVGGVARPDFPGVD